jgi:hypothetical protein
MPSDPPVGGVVLTKITLKDEYYKASFPLAVLLGLQRPKLQWHRFWIVHHPGPGIQS